MIELTAQQIAEGWVAIPDDCVEMPAALADIKPGEFGILFADGDLRQACPWDPSNTTWHVSPVRSSRVVAYRVHKPASPAAQPARPSKSEQDAFEAWLEIVRPSGDAEAVHSSWLVSAAYEDWCADEAAPTDPNASMIARDGTAQTFEARVTALVGNGCIFGTPRAEKCNLLVVAPISATGFSVWGA